MRVLYRCLIWLHPPVFRRDFGAEMLWIFDQATESQSAWPLLYDCMGSLARQWLLRTGWWKYAVAVTLALLEFAFGGTSTMVFGRRQIVAPAVDPAVGAFAGLTGQGALGHQPLTVGILMYLAVFITGGLLVMVIGLSVWLKSVGGRRRVAGHRVR